MVNNSYFNKLREACKEYAKTREKAIAKKVEIAEKYGWNSVQMIKVCSDPKKVGLSPPFSDGVLKAYYSWATAIKLSRNELELWIAIEEDEIKDFLDTLFLAGINTFIYTAKKQKHRKNNRGIYKARLRNQKSLRI